MLSFIAPWKKVYSSVFNDLALNNHLINIYQKGKRPQICYLIDLEFCKIYQLQFSENSSWKNDFCLGMDSLTDLYVSYLWNWAKYEIVNIQHRYALFFKKKFVMFFSLTWLLFYSVFWIALQKITKFFSLKGK